MVRRPPAIGDLFCKTGNPLSVWRVERLNIGLLVAHVVLAKVDDPTTTITISEIALSNPRYFCLVGGVS